MKEHCFLVIKIRGENWVTLYIVCPKKEIVFNVKITVLFYNNHFKCVFIEYYGFPVFQTGITRKYMLFPLTYLFSFSK